MASLRETLTHPDRHDTCVQACSELVEREVAARSGLGGAAIKTGLALLRKVRPTLVQDATRRLVGPFSEALEPWWAKTAHAQEQEASVRAKAFEAELVASPSEVANALLGVTDNRIGDSAEVVQKAYKKLRKGAQNQVETAVPGIAQTLGSVLARP